jgi:hypothetical protein
MKIGAERSEEDGVLHRDLRGTAGDGSTATRTGGPADHAAALAEIENLKVALTTRTVIATAVGILVERWRQTPDEAFQSLVEQSQRSDTKVAAIARELVDEAAARTDGASGSTA